MDIQKKDNQGELRESGWSSPQTAPEEDALQRDILLRRAERARRQRNRRRKRGIIAASSAALVLLGVLLGVGIHGMVKTRRIELDGIAIPSWIDAQIIGEDRGGRDGTPIEKVRDIAIHYVGNPDTTAKANRNYFNKEGVEVSSHFIVGLDGEIVQCLPLGEKSAATNQRNFDTISIEVCHPDATGKFNDDTYASLIKLCAWLCQQLRLDETHLIRHYDVTGKRCPLYYVEHEDAWLRLKADVGTYLQEHPDIA